MYSNSKIAKAVRVAFMFGASAATAISMPAFSEEEQVERITVTGSSIKRTDMEGALPITAISSEDIVRSGVTSVADLMTQIPQMQGFQTAAQSVGGGGGGAQTASLRDLGGEYTLVLINGRRLSSIGSGSAVDLNAIPLAAIERVEVLTDGASAIYGSDAIAGVINFILKEDLQTVSIKARFDKPQETGGESASFSIAGGFGDLSTDGFNIMASFSHDQQEELRSVDRDFASTGILPFEYQGQDLIFQRTSSNAIPANAYLGFADGTSRNLNPFREANGGQCGVANAPEGTTCIYDFTETLRIFPESERDNVFVRGVFEINDSTEAYATASYTKFKLTSRIAPYPTGQFNIPVDSALVQENIIPHLTADEAANLTRAGVRWRTRPGGNRTDENNVDSLSFVAGIKGEIGDVSYDLAFSHSEAERQTERLTGYPIEEELMGLLTSGQVNIFVEPDSLTDEQNQLVAGAMYSGPWQTAETALTSIEGKASMPVFELDAGDVYLGAGFDYREQEFSRANSDANNNEIILFESASPEFDLSRENYGIFVETIVPITEELELTGAIRYDSIGGITDTGRAAGDQKVNGSVDDTTYKVALSYRPTDDLVVRASIGTGFKSPTMREIAEPRIDFGVTSSGYECPFPSSDPRSAGCSPGIIQYAVFREGFADLKPETSEQASVGFVYAPSNEFSFNLDWWQVNLENQVRRLTQNAIFADPVTYSDLFTTKFNRGTGLDELAIIQAAVNIGEANNQGIDYGLDLTNELSFGTLKTSVNGTYIIESERLVVGSDNEFTTSLGQFGTNNAVTFRNIVRISNTLTHGDFEHGLNMTYRSGYSDQYHPGGSTRIRLGSDVGTRYSGGVQLNVPSYMTFNYTGKYFVNENLNVTLGINNLFDKQPPLSLRTGGAGHQVGYDPRYTDVLGRTFYLIGNYTF